MMTFLHAHGIETCIHNAIAAIGPSALEQIRVRYWLKRALGDPSAEDEAMTIKRLTETREEEATTA